VPLTRGMSAIAEPLVCSYFMIVRDFPDFNSPYHSMVLKWPRMCWRDVPTHLHSLNGCISTLRLQILYTNCSLILSLSDSAVCTVRALCPAIWSLCRNIFEWIFTCYVDITRLRVRVCPSDVLYSHYAIETRYLICHFTNRFCWFISIFNVLQLPH